MQPTTTTMKYYPMCYPTTKIPSIPSPAEKFLRSIMLRDRAVIRAMKADREAARIAKITATQRAKSTRAVPRPQPGGDDHA